jgi:hypothetical protein
MTSLASSRTLDVAPTSPLQIELVFDLKLPPEQGFDLVAHRLPEWFSTIHRVSWDHSRSTAGKSQVGACSERTCDFGGKALREVIHAYEPGRRYTYSADLDRSEMKMPLTEHFGSFEVSPTQEGCRVTWRQHFKPKWFAPGAMLRWQMRDKMMKPAVAKLIAAHGGAWVATR